MSTELDWIRAIRAMLRKELASESNELREDDPHSTCAAVKIHRAGKCVFVSFNAEVDNVRIQHRLFPLFQQVEGIGRMCDYWIFYEHSAPAANPVRYVFLVELKSGKDEGLAQLENGKLLAEYFLNMVAYHQRGPHADVKFRALVFSPAYRPLKPGLRPGKIQYYKRGRLDLDVAFLRDEASHSLPSFCD
jgi:hypothetical protein